ncbi:unnamed protein product [Schistosoma margrebowiei]|uniref:Uncharacterized protein n=1 Tax=Schistosoma margrebowiei TaxID=48269 RepID=A0A183M9M5_9TREM|nr:unnamed protein product [Schistosoma margrebowiei]
MNFSDLILRELVYSILHPCDLDSILKLLERLLQVSDSLKSVRIRLLFSYSNDVDLFKLLNSNFIYETNTAAYQVFYLFLNLLFTDPDVITYLSNEIYLVKVLSEVSLTIVLVLMSNCCYISGYNSSIILIYISLLFYFSSCNK